MRKKLAKVKEKLNKAKANLTFYKDQGQKSYKEKYNYLGVNKQHVGTSQTVETNKEEILK